MSSPETIDLESLLAPMSDDAPVGTDPRADPSPVSPYYTVKDARTAARDKERMTESAEEQTGPPPEWRIVSDTGSALLAAVGKDLEIAAYLTEALVRMEGFAGLRDGFRLLHGLIERYWDDIYPLPDEGEPPVEARGAPIAGLNASGSISQPMLMIPLTEGYTYEPFGTYHHIQAVEIAKIAEPSKREERISAGGTTLDMLQTAVKETNPHFFKTLKEDIEEAREAYTALVTVVDEKCGRSAAPATNMVRKAFEQVGEAMEELLRYVVLPEEPAAPGGQPGPEGEAAAPGQQTATVAATGVAVGTESIASREDAFRAMLKIAEFFRRSEPHSPISYTLEELVRRGRMPLAELLAELIPDEEARNNYLIRAGIEPPKPPEE